MSTETTAVTSLATPVVANKREIVKLTKSGLVSDKEAGLTNPEMAKKYNLSTTQISKAMKMCGLERKKAKGKQQFEIVPE